MKGVVLEIKNKYAAVLTEDGSVIKTRRKCSVGDTIELTERDLSAAGQNRTIRFARAAAIAAAVILVVLGASGGYYFTATAASTVTVHSPEGDITLSLNRLDRVIKVEAAGSLQEDTVQTLYSEGIKNCLLPEALEKTSKVLETTGTDTEIAIDIETGSQGKYETLKNQVEEKGFQIGNGDQIPAGREDEDITTNNKEPAVNINNGSPEKEKNEQQPDGQGAFGPEGQSSEQPQPDGQTAPDQEGQSPEQQQPDGQTAPDQGASSSGQPGQDVQAAPDAFPDRNFQGR